MGWCARKNDKEIALSIKRYFLNNSFLGMIPH